MHNDAFCALRTECNGEQGEYNSSVKHGDGKMRQLVFKSSLLTVGVLLS